MSQADQVVAHINKWGSINSIQAIQHYGITRLARVIHDLKGTPRAMMAIADKDSSEGFVKFVPDYKGRHKILINTLVAILQADHIHPRYKAQACLDAASVFTTAYIHEAES